MRKSIKVILTIVLIFLAILIGGSWPYFDGPVILLSFLLVMLIPVIWKKSPDSGKLINEIKNDNEKSIIAEIRHHIVHGKMTVRLIIINVAVFIGLHLLGFILNVLKLAEPDFLLKYITMPSDLVTFIYQPWSILSSIFSHYSLGHLFFNMLFLFFAGSMFEQIFGSKKMLVTYLLGGLFGNLFEIGATLIMPNFSPPHFVLGASGAIMAVFTAIAVYRPQTPIYLFGIIAIPIYVLALFFLAKDLIGIGAADEIAHFAHLGGAFLGYLAVQSIHSNTNIVNYFSSLSFKKSKKTNPSTSRFKTDEEYNADKKMNQERIDAILDKISKSGYESLTREEKDFLFKQGGTNT